MSPHPRALTLPRLSGGGVTFFPFTVMLREASRAANFSIRTKRHGDLPAVPPAYLVGAGIRAYGEQCRSAWASGIKTSRNGLVVTPTDYHGPRETFSVHLKR
ncbi:MAG TPA: hypothetical protein VMH02_12305 [Verrucomicrobiae bacterium]|nr:hypothetical protein [Verrucomicrobiae bacterium]